MSIYIRYCPVIQTHIFHITVAHTKHVQYNCAVVFNYIRPDNLQTSKAEMFGGN